MQCSTVPHECLARGEGAPCIRRLQRIGWRHDGPVGSHKIMKKGGWRDYPFSFHDSDELVAAILAKSQKRLAFNPKTCEVYDT